MSCSFLFLAAILITGAVRRFSKPPATPDFAATIQAIITAAASPAPTTPMISSSPLPPGGLSGKIVFTCQIYKYQSSDQICVIRPDGSGFKRLTSEDGIRHYYPSLSPDGSSVIYSQYREDNVYELFEMSLEDGKTRQISDRMGALTGPEISPDGRLIVFTRWTVASNTDMVWVMNRDGSQPRQVINGDGWDPTWSPDGGQILFASDRSGPTQLYIVNLDGSGLHRITNLPAIRGRSDWSSLDQIVTYSGDAWKRELYLMNVDGSQVHRISPPGGDSQGPSFSPDGKWVAFTAYFDHPGDINGCEIYIIRTDGSDLRRLTDNDYCDYQPRWGP